MEFNSLLKLMVKQKSSDLFITTGFPPTLKVHGKLQPVTNSPLTPDQVRELVFGVMNQRQMEAFEQEHECNFAISASGIGRFRVSAFVQRNNVGMVLRRIETKIPTTEELGLPALINEIGMTKRGMVIFVGGTGTGKSTSLAAMIGYRNQNSSGHIISIEDPIEYVHQHAGCIITQREVGIDTDSFEVALKNTLRQAPDVILIGEIRSRETMEYGLAFSETGHLCLATLHANNANQALDRIINFFPDDRRNQTLLDLSLNLKAIVAQQLIPTVDGEGRCVAVEVMLGTPLVSDLMHKGDIHKIKEVMKRSNQQGMITFDQALYQLYQDQRITKEEALRHADSPNEVRLMIKLAKEGGLERFESATEGLALVDANDEYLP